MGGVLSGPGLGFRPPGGVKGGLASKSRQAFGLRRKWFPFLGSRSPHNHPLPAKFRQYLFSVGQFHRALIARSPPDLREKRKTGLSGCEKQDLLLFIGGQSFFLAGLGPQCKMTAAQRGGGERRANRDGSRVDMVLSSKKGGVVAASVGPKRRGGKSIVGDASKALANGNAGLGKYLLDVHILEISQCGKWNSKTSFLGCGDFDY